VIDDPRLVFIRGDIVDEEQLDGALREFEPDVVVNFAAETHMDRGINEPVPFLHTNVEGVFKLLEATRRPNIPRLVHIGTDEV